MNDFSSCNRSSQSSDLAQILSAERCEPSGAQQQNDIVVSAVEVAKELSE